MPSHNQRIQSALALNVRAGTTLQDAVFKVRRARSKTELEFEIALGQLFVVASEAFKERNSLRNKLAAALQREKTLKEVARGQAARHQD